MNAKRRRGRAARALVLALGVFIGRSAFPAGGDDVFVPLCTSVDKCTYIYVSKGEIVAPPRCENTWGFGATGIRTIRENGKWGYVNARGQRIIPPMFESAYSFAPNGLALVRENGRFGYIDLRGKRVIPPVFERACSFSANGLAWVKAAGDEKGKYIDEEGQIVVSQETLCGVNVLKNARNEILWPKKTAKEICGRRQEKHGVD